MALGKADGVATTIGEGITGRVKALEAEPEAESVTETVNEDKPAGVGDPLSTPPLLRLRPLGNVSPANR